MREQYRWLVDWQAKRTKQWNCVPTMGSTALGTWCRIESRKLAGSCRCKESLSPSVSNPLPQSHPARKIPQQHSSIAKLFSKFHVDESTWMDGWLDMHTRSRHCCQLVKQAITGRNWKLNHDYNQFFFVYFFFLSAKIEKFVYTFSGKKLAR